MTQGERDVLALAYLAAENPDDEAVVQALVDACVRLLADRPRREVTKKIDGALAALERMEKNR